MCGMNETLSLKGGTWHQNRCSGLGCFVLIFMSYREPCSLLPGPGWGAEGTKEVKVVLCVVITGRGKHMRHSRVLCVDPWLGRPFCGSLFLFACVGEEEGEVGRL